nr:unnamed protein product [Callosobruchus analis]
MSKFFNFHFLQRAFSVVEFEDGVCLVPSKWLFRNSTMCFYPPYVNQLKVNKAISTKQSPDEKWQEYKVVRSFCSRGVAKLKLAQEMSDVETDVDGNLAVRPPRIHKSKKRLYESDSDSNTNDDPNDDMPSLPKKLHNFTSSTPIGDTRLISTDMDGIMAQGTSTPKTAVQSFHVNDELGENFIFPM